MSNAVTKEELMAEIDRLPDDKLETLHRFIKGLATANDPSENSGDSFMAKMRKIRINGPADWSENLDDYLYYGKRLK